MISCGRDQSERDTHRELPLSLREPVPAVVGPGGGPVKCGHLIGMKTGENLVRLSEREREREGEREREREGGRECVCVKRTSPLRGDFTSVCD